MKAALARAYDVLETLSRPLQSLVLLVFRLYWGWQFFQTGLGKLRNLDHVTAYFTDLGIPAPGLNAAFVSGLETVGGLLLLLGLASRFIAAPLAFDMVVAYATAERQALMSLFSDPAKFIGADPFFFLLTSVLVLAFGPGAVSLDALIRRRLAAGPPPPA